MCPCFDHPAKDKGGARVALLRRMEAGARVVAATRALVLRGLPHEGGVPERPAAPHGPFGTTPLFF